MQNNQYQFALILNSIPFVGILVFVVLFLYSSSLYPGGSQENLESLGYDWINNYWCNLMSKKAMNGQINTARPFAISAMVILCFSLSIFFYQFADYVAQSNIWKSLIKISGITSMFFAILMFTEYHDLMSMISSAFGLVSVIGIIKEISISKLINYKISGIFCIIMLAVNNVIYYSSKYIEWLPLIQKLTFLIVLIWVLGVNYEIRSKLKN